VEVTKDRVMSDDLGWHRWAKLAFRRTKMYGDFWQIRSAHRYVWSHLFVQINFNCTLQVQADELGKRISKGKVKVPSRCPFPYLSDHRSININISLLLTSLSSMTSISNLSRVLHVKR
jgi:hypothetical protein